MNQPDQSSRSGQTPSSAPSIELVKAAARRIFSAYRKDDYADPDGFVVQLGVILEAYPPTVIDYISHPRTGIQRRCKFPPSLAEITEACDDRASYETSIARLAATPRIARKVYREPEMTEDGRERMRKKFEGLLAQLRGAKTV